MYVKQNKISIVGFCERFPLPPNYADSAGCWSVDQVALSLWLRHWEGLILKERHNERTTNRKEFQKSDRILPAWKSDI